MLRFHPYLLKRGTTWNQLKPPKNYLKPPETSWNQPYYSIFLLKKAILRLCLSYYSNLTWFLGKFGPKNWSSPNWLKVGTGVHCYIFISNLMFIFPKFLSLIFFWANLVRKSEVLQINWNSVQGYIAICLLQFSVYFFKSFVIHIILGKFVPNVWCCPKWNLAFVYIIDIICWL